MKIFLLLVALVVVSLAEQSNLRQLFTLRNREFSANVYKKLAESQEGNLLLCPFSLEVVLALCGIGARNDTASEIFRSVSLPQDPEQIQDMYSDIVTSFNGNDAYTLNSANKLYIQKDFEVLDEFKQVAVNAFGAKVDHADFVGNTSGSIQKINKWVADKTNDKIHDIANDNLINNRTRLLLINALYFNAIWRTPFERYGTSRVPFYISKTSSKEVDMMHIEYVFKYYECSELNAKFLEMEYRVGDVSMTVVLPNERDGLEVLEARLPEVFEDRNYTYEGVDVRLPKFEIESTIQFKPILQNLGMKKAFKEHIADFGGINKQRSLYINDVIQKTFIKVTEAGTEAAASSAVFLREVMLVIPQKQFYANHPFIFFIKKGGIIIFVGRFVG